VKQVVTNEISSTRVRLLIKHQLSIDYLTPDPVIQYIVDHNLYRKEADDGDAKGKEKAQE
jgi:nicotinamide mononucleotide adenylyltransferase